MNPYRWVVFYSKKKTFQGLPSWYLYEAKTLKEAQDKLIDHMKTKILQAQVDSKHKPGASSDIKITPFEGYHQNVSQSKFSDKLNAIYELPNNEVDTLHLASMPEFGICYFAERTYID